VGLLSDALESVVNLVAAIVALVALTVAHQEADEEHAYGHAKAEYFSSGIEGALIVVAAATIAYAAVDRLLHPQPVEQAWLGLGVSSLATLVNLGVAVRLRRAGRRYRSITLEADAKHLMADVVTLAGVVIGVALVALTGWERLDAAVALAVAANITWAGGQLVRRSLLGLLDTALPAEERAAVQATLDRYAREQGVQSTPSARGRRARDASSRCMCWCRGAGRCSVGTRSWRRSSGTSGRRCPASPSSPTWSRSTTRPPGPTPRSIGTSHHPKWRSKRVLRSTRTGR
jgi:cation diffusion facilitator family transporter